MTEFAQMYFEGAAHLIEMQGAATQAFFRQQQDYLRWLQDAVDRYIPPRGDISAEEATRRLEAATAAASPAVQ